MSSCANWQLTDDHIGYMSPAADSQVAWQEQADRTNLHRKKICSAISLGGINLACPMDAMKSARWLSLRWFRELAWNMGVSMAPGAMQNTSTPAYRTLQCCYSHNTAAAVAASEVLIVLRAVMADLILPSPKLPSSLYDRNCNGYYFFKCCQWHDTLWHNLLERHMTHCGVIENGRACPGRTCGSHGSHGNVAVLSTRYSCSCTPCTAAVHATS